MGRFADHPAAAWVLGAMALGIAALGAKPYAGSWNDGCRLAAVESLLDRGTLAIDDSIFCRPPKHLIEAGYPPYDPRKPDLLAAGTFDKLFVRGHFHSDKPAVVSILMAAAYEPLLWLDMPSPGERPDIFCYLMTLLTSGLGYAVAVGCLWVLGKRVGLEPRWRLIWMSAFALSTFAPTYTQYVNTHTLQLAVVSAMCLLLLKLAEQPGSSQLTNSGYGARSASKGCVLENPCSRVGLRQLNGTIALLGTLAGFGFNLDFGSGPPLVAIVFAAIAWRTRSIRNVLIYSAAAFPWIAAGLGINYAIGGVWKPINMYPEHYQFPGTPFTEQNLTGFFRHAPLNQLLYAGGMLIGKHGFVNYNLPLILALTAGWRVLLRPFPGKREFLALSGWCFATWMLYALLSNNMGGACCSVRWFMPFLAPGFWLLARLLCDRPEYRPDYLALSAWGGVLGGLMWWKGPWTGNMAPLLWPIVGLALMTNGVIAWRRWRNRSLEPIIDVENPAILSIYWNERKAA